MNPLKPGARGRTKEDIHSIRHLYLDLDHEAERATSRSRAIESGSAAECSDCNFTKQVPTRVAG